MSRRNERRMKLMTVINSLVRYNMVASIEAHLDQYRDNPDCMPFPDLKYIDVPGIAERVVDDKAFLSAIEGVIENEVYMRFRAVLSERVEIRIEERENEDHKQAHMPTFKPNQ